MQLYSLLGLIFLSATFFTLFVLGVVTRRSSPLSKRLREASGNSEKPDRGEDPGTNTDVASQGEKTRLSGILKALSRLSRREDPDSSDLKLTLMRGGYYHENSVRIFLSLKIVIALSLALIFIVLWYIWGASAPHTILAVLFLPFPFIGYIIPKLVLNSRIRRRQEDIARGLPDALDFLVVCVEAGLGLNAALIRVGKEFGLRCKALGEELLLVNQEMRAGVSREEALRNFGKRSPIEDVRILVGSLIMADKLGTGITNTLRSQADSLRTRVRQRAEETAAQAGIKMVFPLVFLILPALFIVIMGPGIILTLKTMVQ